MRKTMRKIARRALRPVVLLTDRAYANPRLDAAMAVVCHYAVAATARLHCCNSDTQWKCQTVIPAGFCGAGMTHAEVIA